MNCCLSVEKNYISPAKSGTFRFLFGLFLMFVGLYIAILTDIRGHGLGFLLVFGSPFLMLDDDK